MSNHRRRTSGSVLALLSALGVGGEHARLPVSAVALSTPVSVGPTLAMTVFFLVHGVVRNLARRAVLSPLPPTSARIRRTVPSLGFHIRHVGSPARCVPILICRRVRPPNV